MCLVLLIVPLGGGPRHAPVTISAPAVIASSLADQANARADGALDVGVATSAVQARRDVEQGRAVAALVIDLRLNSATFLVSSAQGETLTKEVAAIVRGMAEPFAVKITTIDVAPLPKGSAGNDGLRLFAVGAVVLGLAIAIVAAWLRGPVTDTWSHALRRIRYVVAAVGLTSVALAFLASGQVGGPFIGWWAVLGLTMLATTAATLALAALLGVVGLGIATLVLVVSAAPLARIDHPLLLPTPWGEVTPWLPHGAGLDAARQIAWFGGSGAARALMVLAAWLTVSCVVLAVARRERRRAGVVFSRAS